jgi:hypothetical protein
MELNSNSEYDYLKQIEVNEVEKVLLPVPVILMELKSTPPIVYRIVDCLPHQGEMAVEVFYKHISTFYVLR